MSMTPVYLDYAASTPVDERVAEKMYECLTLRSDFGNPASGSHVFGWRAAQRVETAREQVAALIGAEPKEIVWTSGATESNNLAIKGVAQFNANKALHIVTVKSEHKAVLDSCRQLQREGIDVTYLTPQSNGLLDIDELEQALRQDTRLVSVMQVNNEIGVIQDIEAIGRLTRERGILLHVDAAQSPGRVAIDVNAMNIDLLSLCAHKVYGPKGIGALYIRRRPRLKLAAQIHGGGHEQGMRSGTLATHQIAGMGEACRIAGEEGEEESQRLLALRKRLWSGLRDMEQIYLNGDAQQRVAGNLNISFGLVEGESLIMSMSDIAVSSGSACASNTLEPSYVLKALGRSDELAHSSIRYSLGRYTTAADIDVAIRCTRDAVSRLRAMSPLWEMYLNGIDPEDIDWAVH